jgi:hypothetical protein
VGGAVVLYLRRGTLNVEDDGDEDVDLEDLTGP